MACGDQSNGKSGWLGPLSPLQVALRIQIAFFTTSTKVESSVCFEVKGPDLVRASHCKDECITIDGDNVPRAAQSLRLRRLVSFLIEALLTSSDHGQHLLGRDVDFADCVVLCVAKVQEVLILPENVAEALRMMELSLVVGTIDQANLAIADLVFKLHRLLVNNYKSVVCRVNDHKKVVVEAGLLLDADGFAWVPKILSGSHLLFLRLSDVLADYLLFLSLLLLFFWHHANGGCVIQSFVVEIVGDRQKQIEHLSVTFARQD